MNRRVLIVLVCTFLALVAATVWVPVQTWHISLAPQDIPSRGEDLSPAGWTPTHWTWAWAKSDSFLTDPDLKDRIVWPALVAQVGVILALGGLFALFLRTRAARGAAEA